MKNVNYYLIYFVSLLLFSGSINAMMFSSDAEDGLICNNNGLIENDNSEVQDNEWYHNNKPTSHKRVRDYKDSKDYIKLINQASMIKKDSKCKKAVFQAGNITYKVFIVGFMALIIVGGYFIITDLINGCSQMQKACLSCSNQLHDAENAMGYLKNVSSLVQHLLKNCPKAKQDILQLVLELNHDCC